MQVNIKILPNFPKGVSLPAYATTGSSGMDLRAAEQVKIFPGETALLRCGFSLEIPPGFEAQIRSRSGLALKNNVVVLNSPGTIDSDYRGEIGAILHNFGYSPFPVEIGDRIAQMVFVPVIPQVRFQIVSELGSTGRGSGGYGSTGKE